MSENGKKKRKINYYLLILDKSGSMGSVAEQTRTGFNEQVQMIKDLGRKYSEQEFVVSLVTFNHDIDTVFFNAEADKLDELKEKDYLPDGMTAMYDAIGLSVNRMQNEIKDEMKDEDAQVIVTIFTDGYDNSSKEFNKAQSAQLCKKLQETKKWTFCMIGSNIDVTQVGHDMNITNVAAFDSTAIGTHAAMRAYSGMLARGAELRSHVDNTKYVAYTSNMMEGWDASYADAKESLATGDSAPDFVGKNKTTVSPPKHKRTRK